MIKVAGYCRVSTDHEDQSNSFQSQQRFFREHIQRHPEWELYDIYADEGITGTSTKKRTHFNRMINDAYQGKFNMIITKEVSRFSRNILDTIAYTRELKALGIGVIFMSDGFSTLDPDAELRLSIMGSIAQEESRKTSTRVKWGQTRQMERGVVFGRSMLGYDVKNGKMTINPQGAQIVEQIFYKYGIEKKGSTVIARELREAGIRTYTNNPYWSSSQILKILRNEKYVGDLIQKKTFTPDYLTHEKKYNHGEEAMVAHRNHHEPIVSRELWDLVQQEIKKRNRNNKANTGHSSKYVFSGKIRCAECGAQFVSRVKYRKDGTVYRRWSCLNTSKYGKKKSDLQGNEIGCDVGKHISDDLATKMLVYILQNLNLNYDCIIKNAASVTANILCRNGTFVRSPEKTKNRLEQLTQKKTDAVDAYLSGIISKTELEDIKNRYNAEIDSLNVELLALNSKEIKPFEQIYKEMYGIIESIVLCKSSSESYLRYLLEYMVVHENGMIEMKLKQLSSVWRFQLQEVNRPIPVDIVSRM